MTTSANVNRYVIRHNGIEVGTHSQHTLCKYSHHELLKFSPPEQFTIQMYWEDEDEVTHEYEEKSLQEYLQQYYDMGYKYRDGCTIQEVFNAPKGKWGIPDLIYVKAHRQNYGNN